MANVVSVIRAIHDSDLVRVLHRLGLYEKLVSGKLGALYVDVD